MMLLFGWLEGYLADEELMSLLTRIPKCSVPEQVKEEKCRRTQVHLENDHRNAHRL